MNKENLKKIWGNIKSYVDKGDNKANTNITNLNANTGISDYEDFSDQKEYKAGTTVKKDGLLYTFITDHAAGAWDESEVENGSLKSDFEIKNAELSNTILADSSGGNYFIIPTLAKSNNRIFTKPFSKNYADCFIGVTLSDTENYEIILGVSDNDDMSDEKYYNNWTNSIDLSRVDKAYFRITARKKDESDISPSDVILLSTSKAVNRKEFENLKEEHNKNTEDIKSVKDELKLSTDYSDYEITNGYIYNDGKNFFPSSTSDCTGFIAVNEGDTIVYSGYPGGTTDLNAIAGYTEEDLSTGVNLLSATGSQMDEVEIVIPSGIKYIRAWSRNSTHPSTPSKLSLIITSYLFATTAQLILLQQKVAQNTKDIANIDINLSNIPKPCFVYSETPMVLLSGASFATANGTDSGWEAEINGYNRWFETACKELGITGINHAIGGQSIINTANMMLDADDTKPHGTLFFDNDKDVFDDVDVFVIMQVHNQDVYYTGNKTLEEYKSQGVNGYAEAFDYVIKQYMDWCLSAKDDNGSKYHNVQSGKPCQILFCTHWHDARTIYNNSIRRLCIKTGFPLCEFDKNVGFSKNYPMPNGQQVSIYHCWNSDAEVGTGAKEIIDGVTYGWHMKKPNYSSVNEYTLSYIQNKISNIFKDCIQNGLNILL